MIIYKIHKFLFNNHYADIAGIVLKKLNLIENNFLQFLKYQFICKKKSDINKFGGVNKLKLIIMENSQFTNIKN